MIKWKIQGIPTVGESMEKLEFLHTASGNVNWYICFGKYLPEFIIFEYIQTRNTTPKYTANRNAHKFTKNVYNNVNHCTIHNSPKLEVSKYLWISGYIVTQWNTIYSNENKQIAATLNSMDETHKYNI